MILDLRGYKNMRGRHGVGFGERFGGGFRGDNPRMRRGDIKYFLLEVLKDKPMHGYEIINSMEARRGGCRPSAGSVYPTLQMLEEGGYLTGEQVDGKKVYTITDAGRKLLEERGASPFETTPEMSQAMEVGKAMMKLGAAVMQGVRGADEETVKRISDIINKARKDVYAILAEA